MNKVLSIFAGLVSTLVPLSAQWLNYPTPGIPRLPDGKANLSAPVPKTADGKPDLSGIWQLREPMDFFGPFTSHFMNLALDLKPQEAPLQPWAKALSEQRKDNNHKDDPLASCLPAGTPRIETISPFKIIQTPPELVMLFETTANSTFRQIFTDGRPLPTDPQPTWLGYSVGKWEGDMLKVDTVGFTDKGWLDTGIGLPQTEALHVTERFRRTDFGHMEIGITIDDPKAYTKPWSATLKVNLVPDTEIIETTCENAVDSKHMVGK